MINPKPRPTDRLASPNVVQQTWPGMPIFVADDEAFREAVAEGDADIEAGHTVPFADVAARLRRAYGRD